MRTVRRNIPMDLIVPKKYNVILELNGDKSTLDYTEEFEEGLDPKVMELTISVAKCIVSPYNCTIESKDNMVHLKITSDESTLLRMLVSEFQNAIPNTVLPSDSFLSFPNKINQ